MKKSSLRDVLRKKVVLFDGGMGSMLIAGGLSRSEVPESWNLTNPEKLLEIHNAYLEAGAEVIQTNTFGANRIKLSSSDSGKALDVLEVNEKGIEQAKKAIGRFSDAGRFLAGEIGPTGLFFPPVGNLTPQQARKAFGEQARIFERAGVDLIMIETMYDAREAVEAVRAVRECSDLPVVAELTFEKKPRGYFTLVGDTPERAAEVLLGSGADVVGANCTLSSGDMIGLVAEFRRATDAPIIFQPNAGNPVMEHGVAVYKQRPQDFASDIEKMVKAGASAVGGCCGTNPDFIRAAHERLTHGG